MAVVNTQAQERTRAWESLPDDSHSCLPCPAHPYLSCGARWAGELVWIWVEDMSVFLETEGPVGASVGTGSKVAVQLGAVRGQRAWTEDELQEGSRAPCT